MKEKINMKRLGVGIACAVLVLSITGGIITFAVQSNSDYITEGEAKAIALEHAGVTESETSFITCKLDYDDGVAEFDVEFWVDSNEYDYEINAKTAAITDFDYDAEYNYTVPTDNSADYIGEEKAKSIAFEHANLAEADTTLLKVQLDYDDGVAEYEVEFLSGNIEYDFEINAITGDIISYDYDMESYSPPQAEASTPVTTDYIGEEKAKSIAFADAGVNVSDAHKIDCEFDFDDGVAEYEVEWKIGNMEYEYKISATDGTIWERDIEQDD